jgi:hypothetical protein
VVHPARWLTVHYVNYDRLGHELISDVRVLGNRDHLRAHQADESAQFCELEAAPDFIIVLGKHDSSQEGRRPARRARPSTADPLGWAGADDYALDGETRWGLS